MKTPEDIIGRVIFILSAVIGGIAGIIFTINTNPECLAILAFGVVGLLVGSILGLTLVVFMFGIISLFK